MALVSSLPPKFPHCMGKHAYKRYTIPQIFIEYEVQRCLHLNDLHF